MAECRLLLLVCAFGLLVATPASAEWVIGAFAGGCRTRDTHLTLTLPSVQTSVALSPVHYDSESFEFPIYYGYRIAAFPHARWFGLEGEFVHLKVVADTSRSVAVEGVLRGITVRDRRVLSEVIERFSISHGVNLLLVNVVLRRRASGWTDTRPPLWMLMARMGAGASIPHPESTMDGVSSEGYEWGALSVQGSAAAEVRVGGPVYLSGEYKLTRTTQNVTVTYGSARTPLVTHHVAVGISVHVP
jgi:hypothetical protein